MLPSTISALHSLPRPLTRTLRRLWDFLYYDGVELLVILLGVAVILFDLGVYFLAIKIPGPSGSGIYLISYTHRMAVIIFCV